MTEPTFTASPIGSTRSRCPGAITQGNALPWQADFLLCRDDSEDPQHGESALAWWPAQRPDKVFVDIASAQTGKNPQPWARGIPRELDEVLGN